MKSNPEQLRARGFISSDEYRRITGSSDFSFKEDLTNTDPQRRTASARFAGDNPAGEYLPLLSDALRREKKLYTKIELCETLAKYGEAALDFLIPLLGKIGSNQHKEPENCDLGKKSFPCPRDISARIIIRIGPCALPRLCAILFTEERSVISEAIEAIGHISFTSGDQNSAKFLAELYRINSDELIEWKLIRAFQSFNDRKIAELLEQICNTADKSDILKNESRRSLRRIHERIGTTNV